MRNPYGFLDGGYPGKIRATIHEPIPTKDLDLKSREEIKQKTRDIILNELKALKKKN